MNLADPLVIVVASKGASVNRRIAGMTVVARIAAEASAAGARELWVVDDRPPSLSRESLEDIARASASLRVSALSSEDARARLSVQPGRPLQLISASHLVPSRAFARLQSEGVLASAGKIVAATGIAGESLPILGRPAAGDSPVIALADRKSAIRAIVRDTSKPSDGIISRHLNRPISQRITAALLSISDEIQPWQMTLVVALVTLAMFLALILGRAPGLLAGALLFHTASVLDGVDGEIARSAHRSSVRGAVLDTAVDMAGNLLFILGLTVGLTRLHGIHYAEMGAWAFGAGISGLIALAALTHRIGEYGNFNILKDYYYERFATGFPAQVRRVLTRILSRDFFAFGCFVLTLFGKASLCLWGFTGFMTLWVVLIAAAAPTILRRAATLPTRASPATT